MNENVTMPMQKASLVLTADTAFTSDEHFLLYAALHMACNTDTWYCTEEGHHHRMKLGKDPGDTSRTPASFHTAVSCFFGEYQKQRIEPAVTKTLQRRREKKDKQYNGGHVLVPMKEGTWGTKWKNQGSARTWTNVSSLCYHQAKIVNRW